MATTKSTELGQLGRLLSVDSSGVVITGLVTVGSIVGDGSGLTGVTSYVESDFFEDLQLDSARTIIRVYFSAAGDATYDSATGVITVSVPPSYGDSDVGAYLLANNFDSAAAIIATIVDTAPSTLDTLNELAAALGDDPNFATTVTNALATKYDSDDVRTLVDSDYVRERAAKFIQNTYVYSATSGQTVFTGLDVNSLTLSYTQNNLLVQVNGVILLNGEDYTATDGSTVTLTIGADSGDDVVVNAFSSFDVTFGQAFEQDYEYNATAGQTIFSNSDQNGNVLNVNTQGTIVTLNGLTLRATDDYSISQTAVTLSVAADSGDEVLIRTFKKLSVADTVSATNGGTFSNSITAKTVKAAQPFFVNSQTVSENFTIEAGTSAMAAGPVTINSGVTVSISSGSRWVIV